MITLCWVTADPRSARANTFVSQVAESHSEIIVLDSLRACVLERLAMEFQQDQLDAGIASLLADDVSDTVSKLMERTSVSVLRSEPMLAPGFVLATLIGVDLSLGICLFVAAATGVELLLAAPMPGEASASIRERYPNLTVLTLQDYA